MGKLGSFATGVGAGYLASERYKDSKKRQDRQDSVLEKFLGVDAGYKPMDAANPVEEEDPMERFRVGNRAANGGMVAPSGIRAAADMPQHWDKMDWQRQSFKK